MPSRFQEMLKKQRENTATSRAGLKWEAEEDTQLLNMISENESIPNIACFLQRTEGSIRTRLILYAINKMEKDNLSLEQVAELIKLPTSDITDYQNKKATKIEKLKNTPKKLKHDNITNADIYNLLLSIKKSLDER